MFETMSLLGREEFISPEIRSSYRRGLCPIAEQIQPRLLQFKTNYWDLNDAVRQAGILKKTIESF
jgi:perosamine synthetase